MSVVFTLTESTWSDLISRMHGEGILCASLYIDEDTTVVGVAGQTSDMILFLSHVAALIEEANTSSVTAMEHLRYFADQVRLRDHIWWLPCVKVQKESKE